MTDSPEELKARARHAFERSTARDQGEFHGPVHPDELARMERAMMSLPRMTREVFLARRLDGYSYDQIATVTRLSRRQVERRMRAALHRLGRYMRGDERSEWQRWWQARLPRWFR